MGLPGSGEEGLRSSAPRGQDTSTSLLRTSSSSWSPLLIFIAPCTVPRHVLSFSHTSLGEGFTTWIRKQVLEASTRILAIWRFPGTGTLRGLTKALEAQTGPVTAALIVTIAMSLEPLNCCI